MAWACIRFLGHISHRERLIQPPLGPRQQLCERVIAPDLNRRRHKLGLTAGTVRLHNEAAGDGISDRRAMVEVDQMQAEIHGGGFACGSQHTAVVRVKHIRVDHGQRMAGTELRGMRPVGCRSATVQQSCGAEQERSGAERSNPGTRFVGCFDGIDQLHWRRIINVSTCGHDDHVGTNQAFQPVLGIDHERANRHRSRPAEQYVVPALSGFTRGIAEDLVGHRQLKVQRTAGSQQRNRGHVRKCTHDGVPDHDSRTPPWATLDHHQRNGDRGTMKTTAAVVVYGATGHTGRFVVAELQRRGIATIISGRDAAQLSTLATEWPEVEVRPSTVDDPNSLDEALAGAMAVINCAGPFALTAGPVVEAALRAGIAYVDVAAEIEANVAMFANYAQPAQEAGVPVVPAMAFYGGLGDLLVTAAMGDWTAADEVHVAYGLSSWHPTAGTRVAGKVSHDRRAGRRVRFTDGALQYHDDPAAEQDWVFPEPLGTRAVFAEFSMADIVTVPSHLAVPEVRTYMTVVAAKDLASQDTPEPQAVDGSGRSDQTFVVDVLVRKGGVERRAIARGQDIYAVTAPLAVEAVERILAGHTRARGVVSAGAAFDATDFLRALAPHITVELPRVR